MSAAVLPELKELIGAMLFVRKETLSVADVLRVLKETAERNGGVAADYAAADAGMVQSAFEEVAESLARAKLGFRAVEVAGGWRLENDVACGAWLRVLLNKGKATRLSVAALETLAIIAYRQPCVRSEIEAVRGVAVDSILKNLLELELVRVTGRSDLPGRPWMFGTTQKFMEHFGLRSLDDLPGTDELRRLEAEQKARGARKREGITADGEPLPPEHPNQMHMAGLEQGAGAAAGVSPEEAVGAPGELFAGSEVAAEPAVEEIPEEEEEQP